MERFTHSLKILWRTERMLTERQLQLATQRIQFSALASLAGFFGLVMVSLGAFFALEPGLGKAGAAFAVGCADFALAAALLVYARSLQPAPEVAMVREIRAMALSDLEEEAALTQAELATLQKEIRKFIHHPVDALIPGAVGTLFNGVLRFLDSRKK